MKFEIKLIGDYDNIDDAQHLKRLIKANEMAIVLFEIVHNLWRNCETIEEYKEKIVQELDNHSVDLEDILR